MIDTYGDGWQGTVFTIQNSTGSQILGPASLPSGDNPMGYFDACLGVGACYMLVLDGDSEAYRNEPQVAWGNVTTPQQLDQLADGVDAWVQLDTYKFGRYFYVVDAAVNALSPYSTCQALVTPATCFCERPCLS